MKYGSVCSGIEAATVAWHPLGWSPAFFSEIEPFPCAVLKHHYPEVPNHGDMTKYNDWPEHRIDVLVGGTPCQAFSVAGLRKGLADPRGNLTLTYLAIAAKYRPRWLVWENVPGVLSDQTGAFGALLGGLGELGYGFAYRILDAQYFGVAQRRRRVFVVGYLGDWRRAAAVLFERHSLQGHPAPSRQARQRPAPTLSARTKGGGGLGTDFDLDGGLIHCPDVSPAMKARDSKGPSSDGDGDGLPLIAHSLRGEGFDASEDGTGRGTPLVPVHAIQAGALRENPNSGPDGVGVQSDISYTLEARAEVQAIAYRTTGNCGVQVQGDKVACLNTGTDQNANIVRRGMAVRRLTPRECERLQGFPDDNTLIPHRGKPAKDGPRYKSLGNSMCTNVMHWIGQRIQQVDSL